MSLNAAPLPAKDDLVTRLVYLLKRVAARVIDGLVISMPMLAGVFAAWVVIGLITMVIVGGGGGIGGLLTGGVFAVVASVLVFLIAGLAIALIPAGYLVWAGRRTGEHAHQTLGHQLMGLRIERTGGRPVSGRTLLAHELAFVGCYLGFEIAAVTLAATFDQAALTTVAMLLGGAWLVWLALSGRPLPHDLLGRTRTRELPAAAVVIVTTRPAG